MELVPDTPGCGVQGVPKFVLAPDQGPELRLTEGLKVLLSCCWHADGWGLGPSRSWGWCQSADGWPGS